MSINERWIIGTVLVMFFVMVWTECAVENLYENGCMSRCEQTGQIYHAMGHLTGCLCADKIFPVQAPKKEKKK